MKKLLITFLLLLPLTTNAGLGDGLVRWFPMDNRDGSTANSIKDRITGLTLVKSGTPSIDNGIFGQSIKTDTNNWYTSYPTNVTAPSNFTISTWIYASTTIITNSDIWAYRSTSCGAKLPIVMYVGIGNDMYFQIENTANQFKQIVVNNSGLTLNKWHLLSASYDGTNMALYLNGVVIGTTTSTIVIDQTAVPFYIGNSACTDQSWRGWMDDLRIYNRALTYAEQVDLYRQGISNRNVKVRGTWQASIMSFLSSIF